MNSTITAPTSAMNQPAGWPSRYRPIQRPIRPPSHAPARPSSMVAMRPMCWRPGISARASRPMMSPKIACPIMCSIGDSLRSLAAIILCPASAGTNKKAGCRGRGAGPAAGAGLREEPSVHQLQRELDLPRRIGRADRAERRVRDGRVRKAEVGVVDGVEELAAELQRGPLPDRKLLVDAEVPLVEARSTVSVAARISERRRWRWHLERGAIEVVVEHVRRAQVRRVADHVWTHDRFAAVVRNAAGD